MNKHGSQARERVARWNEGRRATALAVSLSVAAVLLVSVSALAAKPRAGGCWGTCGGDSGPVGGYFVVAGGQVQEFQISERCLGKLPGSSEFSNNLQVPKMKIDRQGDFSFEGNGKRSTGSGFGAVKVILKGQFATPTKAKILLTIKYEKCGTSDLTIVRKG